MKVDFEDIWLTSLGFGRGGGRGGGRSRVALAVVGGYGRRRAVRLLSHVGAGGCRPGVVGLLLWVERLLHLYCIMLLKIRPASCMYTHYFNPPPH
jgi:hypothetical protein